MRRIFSIPRASAFKYANETRTLFSSKIKKQPCLLVAFVLDMTPTGDEIRRQPLSEVVHWFFVFIGFWKSEVQLSRNELIRVRAAAGEALSDIARAFGISPQRIHQIVHFKNK